MARKATRIKAPAAEPLTRLEAEALMADIGRLLREIHVTTLGFDERVSALNAERARALDPLGTSLSAQTERLRLWAEANREQLLEKGSKTFRLATGEIAWRMDPKSVRITGEPDVIATLQRLGLTAFLRTKVEIDKEAILKEPEKAAGIAGISIKQGEQLVLRPDQTEIEPIEILKKAVAS